MTPRRRHGVIDGSLIGLAGAIDYRRIRGPTSVHHRYVSRDCGRFSSMALSDRSTRRSPWAWSAMVSTASEAPVMRCARCGLEFLGHTFDLAADGPHFLGHDRKAASVFARPGRFDHCVQGQDPHLAGDLLDPAGLFCCESTHFAGHPRDIRAGNPSARHLA